MHWSADSRLVAAEYLPAGHTNAADAPSGQKLPASHALHPVAPVPSWNVPAPHGSHVAFPVWLEKLPAPHADGRVLPAAQKCPSGHGVHSGAEVRIRAAE